MTSGRSDLIDVTVEMRSDDPARSAIAVYDGKDDKQTGREKWIWLPRSQIEIERKSDRVIVVTLPEWLAQDKGLI